MNTAFVEHFWQRVERWARSAGMPADLLAPPAGAAQLDALDAALVPGCPVELRSLLARHDGGGAGWYCFSDGNFLSSTEILKLVAERAHAAADTFGPDAGSPECMGAVRPLWWSELWVPFLLRNKEPICLDLGPAPGGGTGQVISVDWEGRLNRVVAANFESFLEGVVKSLR